MTDEGLLLLLHDWTIMVEHDGGYVLARCAVCGREDLLNLVPATRGG